MKNSERKKSGWIVAVVVVIAAAVIFLVLKNRGPSQSKNQDFAEVIRGDLEIVVLEGGNVKALESLELKSQVEHRESKILEIVDEGYEVTAEDVKNKKVLIKLDPTEVKTSIEEHDIDYEEALAEKTETDEQRAIQLTESEKEIKEARQTVRFALLDFEKYLGEEAAKEVLSERELPTDEKSLSAYEKDFEKRLLSAAKPKTENPGASSANLIGQEDRTRINFTKFLDDEKLGDGEAQQELSKRQDELLVAQTELVIEERKVVASERLAKNDFITQSSLEAEKLTLKKAQVKEISASNQLGLFRRYEFPKKAEELLTKYEDSLHLLDREKKEALAKLAQAEAKYRSAEQLMALSEKRREKLAEQLDHCEIVATKPGLVIYGSPERQRYYGSDDKIEVGSTIYYRRTIITIPDMRRLGVKVSIQESQIKKVKVGQKVRIVTDAEADKILTGEVKKVAVLPDSNRWYDNPNQKVYPTEIHIDGTHDWLKPGMSAKLEIVVENLSDVLKIPLQCVMIDEGDSIVFVKRAGKPERQVVEIGGFTDEFIEIKSGVEEGEQVFLSKPDGVELSEEKDADDEKK